MTCAPAPMSIALDPRLAHADPGVRRIAVLDIADAEDDADLPQLAAALRDDVAPEVRAEAARVLGGRDHPEAVDALARALLDPDAGVRESAAAALAQLKDAGAGARLLPWAGHERADVRAAALRALKELRLPAAAVPALASLDHADAAVRREAVGVLGWLKAADTLPAIGRLAVDDPDAEVRRVAAGALGLAAAHAHAVVLPALFAALRDAAWPVREEAATTLAKLAPPAALDALLAAMDDAAWQVRLRAARALGRLRDARALPPLSAALGHAMGNLRKEAAIALGEIGAAEAEPALRAAVQDPDPEVRKVARSALARLEAA